MNEISKIKWLCRRGMLEPQLMLEKFVENHLENLTEKERGILLELLEYPDPVLFAWFIGQEKPSSPELCEMVERIRA